MAQIILIRYLRERWGLICDYPLWLFIIGACLSFLAISLFFGITLVLIIPDLHGVFQDGLLVYFGISLLLGSTVSTVLLVLAYYAMVIGRCLWRPAEFPPDWFLQLEEEGSGITIRIAGLNEKLRSQTLASSGGSPVPQ